MMSSQPQSLLSSFDEQYFGEYFSESDRSGSLTAQESALISRCESYVQGRFTTMKYILGMAIDFTLLAQCLRKHDESLANFDPTRSEEVIFAKYTLVTQRGARQSNTLTLKFGNFAYGIRKLEELVLGYFYQQRKLGYPSAYVYNTGQWAKFKELLVYVFTLSSFGRLNLLSRLISFGNESIAVKSLSTLPKKDVGDFSRLLSSYERTYKGENGGLVFQAIAYGFASVVYGHLNLSASSVRTGSSRQHRFGDIDAYSGAVLIASIEAKDIDITEDNFDGEIRAFLNEVATTNVHGLVFCKTCSTVVYDTARELAPTLGFVTELNMLEIARIWDDWLQQKAVEGVIHFLANIEHNEPATKRALEFLDL